MLVALGGFHLLDGMEACVLHHSMYGDYAVLRRDRIVRGVVLILREIAKNNY
jgi:hypothetical protein